MKKGRGLAKRRGEKSAGEAAEGTAEGVDRVVGQGVQLCAQLVEQAKATAARIP